MTKQERVRLTREEGHARTRALLLHSARAEFSKHGYVGTSIEKIAESAGYSKGAFYSNFTAKEDVFLELLAAHMTEEAQALNTLISSLQDSSGIPALLKKVGDLYRAFEVDVDWGLLVLEFNLHAGRDPQFFETFSQRFVIHREKIASIIAQLFRLSGASLPCPALDIAITLIGLSYGIPVQRAAFPSSIPKGLLGNMIEVILGAFINDGVRIRANTNRKGNRP
jgi:TetR/AcrR family transcriptional regulator, transcriptional repressor of aconitase